MRITSVLSHSGAVLLAGLLAACTLPARNPAPSLAETRVIVQRAPASEVEQLLSYANKLRKFDAKEAAIDREALRITAARERTDFARVKYAIALAVLTTPGGAEDAEITAALEPLISSAAASDVEVRSLAAMLYTAATDRRRLREQVRELQAKSSQVRREDTREAETRALRARVEELEAKITALKSIDRSVNRRTEPK